MPRDNNVPSVFDVYTVVVLRRPAGAPDLPQAERPDVADALQSAISERLAAN